MSDEIQAPGRNRQPKPASGGRSIAVFALLLAMAGLGGFAYLYYTVVFLDPDIRIDHRMSALEGGLARLRGEVQRLNREQHDALDALRTAMQERQRAATRDQAESMQRITVPELPAQSDWKLAEVEYLLRIANHRVLMERDVNTALDLLDRADSILGGLDDVALHAVRATLATEILSLEQAPSADIPGIYLRLDAVKRQLNALTLANPQYSLRDSTETDADDTVTEASDEISGASAPVAAAAEEPAGSVAAEAVPIEPADAAPATGTASAEAAVRDSATPEPEAPGFLEALVAELGSFVRFRRIDSGFNPPPTPEEAAYLELNLRLLLEQAQLAALRYEQAVYAASLDAALDLIGAYLDRENPAVRETIQALEALRGLDVEAPLPDISASLQELQNAREAGR